MPFFSRSSDCRQALFLAPMAGITNSAFRRLVSDMGGCSAAFTEMLHARGLLSRNTALSPQTKKRSTDCSIIYQVLLTGEEDIPKVIDRLRLQNPAGIDLNAGCSAPAVTRRGSGFALFRNIGRFTSVVKSLRREWSGPLSVKCRLGSDSANWQDYLRDVMTMLEDQGADFIIIHPRFDRDKLKRPAQWKHIPWIKSVTKLPVVVNGDIVSMRTVLDNPETLGLADGIMLGRIAAARPWIFRDWSCASGQPDDHLEIWKKYVSYVREDFRDEEVLGRVKAFTIFFARNFIGWHEFVSLIQPAADMEVLYERAVRFLGSSPELTDEPSFWGI
jgi:tRNA-dihydrouridine synthase B